MKKFKTAIFLTLMLLTACEPISQQLPENDSASSYSSSKSSDDSGETGENQENSVLYTEYTAKIPEIENKETSVKIEAEDYNLSGSLYTSDKRKGFSGTGYVTGFYGGSADNVNLTVMLDANQHYDITLCAAADQTTESKIKVNGKELQEFTIDGSPNFTKITLYGIYMNSGENQIIIESGKENFDLDYIEITNNQSIYDTKFEFENTAANENISAEASALLKQLKADFGKKIVTGQYASDEKNAELELIHKITGKYPAIRFSDIGGYSENSTMMYQDEANAALDWAKKGGIVGFMWYWNSPAENNSSVYSEKTDFNLKVAMTKTDIALEPISELEDLYKKGLITLECLEIVKDIDAVSNSLLVLADENIPVLWRPLHEAGGGWYWWGAQGAEAYKWLYDLMFERMTYYHKLNNLIWVWNGQSEDFMVDDYDIAAIDIYMPPDTDFGSRSEQYQWLKNITEKGKLLALSECSSLPSLDDMIRDNSLWSFFGLWFGDYLTDANGELSEIYTRRDSLIKMYNAQNSVTLDLLS